MLNLINAVPMTNSESITYLLISIKQLATKFLF